MTDEPIDPSIDQELSSLIDGELIAERAAELNARVASDPELKARLSELKAVNESLRSLTPTAMPADMRARLKARIDDDSATAIRPVASETSMGWGKPLAAALAAGLIAAWLLLPGSNSDVAQVAVEIPVERVPETTIVETTQPVIEVVNNNTLRDADVEPTLDAPSDEELAIAFELETLRDLDVIQDLDLLEALLAMEDAEEQTHNDEERG